MAQIILDSNNNLIQGDFDNATLNNRTKLQTTTTNATTNVYVVPNGSSTSAGVSVANNSSLTNASKIVMATNGSTDTQIISGVNGSGTYLPMSFYVNNTLALQISTAGVVTAPYGGFSGAGPTVKYVTDTTNITLVNIASSQVNVGSSFSVSIPTTGYINVTSFAGRLTWSSVADNVGCVLGIRIGSTNYWFGKWSNNGTILYAGICGSRTSAGFDEWYGSLIKFVGTSANANDAAPLGLDIAANSIPTGTQTVQLIAAYGAVGFTGIGILSGATTTTRVALEFVTAS
jgi:hypothetical protein